jgi:hypothetical protein
MNNKEIIILYKEVGKDPVFEKIQNTKEAFKNLLGGDIETIFYEDVVIVCRKDRERLNPNIYLNTTFGELNLSIRGNIILASRDLNSLTEEQLDKYERFLIQESFKYSHFDKNGKYLSNKELKKQNQLKPKTNLKVQNQGTLNLILEIQALILQFLKNYTNND